MKEQKDIEYLQDLYDDRYELHFLMELLKHEVLSDEYGGYIIWEKRKLFLTKRKPGYGKISFSY